MRCIIRPASPCADAPDMRLARGVRDPRGILTVCIRGANRFSEACQHEISSGGRNAFVFQQVGACAHGATLGLLRIKNGVRCVVVGRLWRRTTSRRSTR